MTQGLLVDPSLRLLGRAGHTLAGNVLFGLGYLLLGLARKPYQLMVTLVSAKQARPTSCESLSGVCARTGAVHAGEAGLGS